MSLAPRGALRYHLLAPLRRIRAAWREREFRAVPRVPADTRALGRVAPDRLAALLAPTGPVAAQWAEDERTVAALGLPEMTGGVNPGDQRALHALVLGLRPSAILEVGTHIGCSTVSLALAARRVGAHILSCDVADVNDETRRPWVRYGSPKAPRALLEQAGCGSVVEFRTADSLVFLRSSGPEFDLIFLDGDHSAGTVYRELAAACVVLRPGGCIVLHDYFSDNRPLFANDPAISGPYLAVERLREEGAALSVQPFGALPWRTRVGSHMTTLAVVSSAE